MDRNLIIARVCTVIADIADDMNHVSIRPGAQLLRDLGLDSFGRVELLNAVEDEFSLSFRHPQDRELSHPETTVLAIAEAIEQQLAPKGQPAAIVSSLDAPA